MNRDLREHSKQTKLQLIVIFIIILFVVGLGLIWLLYGIRSALLGLLCLIGTIIPVGLISVLIIGLDKLLKKQD